MTTDELLILNILNDNLSRGHFTLSYDDLFEKLEVLCFDFSDTVDKKIEYLWENDFINSSNGSYYITDKGLEVLQKINRVKLLD